MVLIAQHLAQHRTHPRANVQLRKCRQAFLVRTSRAEFLNMHVEKKDFSTRRKHGGLLVEHLFHTWFHGGTGVQILARDELFL